MSPPSTTGSSTRHFDIRSADPVAAVVVTATHDGGVGDDDGNEHIENDGFSAVDAPTLQRPHGGGAHGSRNGCEAAPADGDPDRDAGAGGDGGVNEEEESTRICRHRRQELGDRELGGPGPRRTVLRPEGYGGGGAGIDSDGGVAATSLPLFYRRSLRVGPRGLGRGRARVARARGGCHTGLPHCRHALRARGGARRRGQCWCSASTACLAGHLPVPCLEQETHGGGVAIVVVQEGVVGGGVVWLRGGTGSCLPGRRHGGGGLELALRGDHV